MNTIQVPYLKRLWIKIRGENRDALVPLPLSQLSIDCQRTNAYWYYAIAELFDKRPECEMINDFEVHKSDKPDCFLGHLLPIQTSGYPYYSFLDGNLLFVVGFTGLHYFSFMFNWPYESDLPHKEVLDNSIEKCSVLKFTGFDSGFTAFENNMKAALRKKLGDRYRLTDRYEKIQFQMGSAFRYISGAMETLGNQLDDLGNQLDDLGDSINMDLSYLTDITRKNNWWFVKTVESKPAKSKPSKSTKGSKK